MCVCEKKKKLSVQRSCHSSDVAEAIGCKPCGKYVTWWQGYVCGACLNDARTEKNWVVWWRNGPDDISGVLDPELPPGPLNYLIHLIWISINCHQYLQQNPCLKQYMVTYLRDKVTKSRMEKIYTLKGLSK